MWLLYILTILFFAFDVQANPIVIHHSHDFIWWWGVGEGVLPIWYALITAIAGLLAEYLFIKTYTKKISKFMRQFSIINSITFPITQIVALYVGLLSELIPIIAEKLFYSRNREFKEIGYKAWLVVIIGNAISWFIGYVSNYFYFKYMYEV